MTGLKLHWADEPRIDRRETSSTVAGPSSSRSELSTSASSSLMAAEHRADQQRAGSSILGGRRASGPIILAGLPNASRPGNDPRRSISASTSPSPFSLWSWSAIGGDASTTTGSTMDGGGARRMSSHALEGRTEKPFYAGGEVRRPSLSAGGQPVGLLSAKMREHQGMPQQRQVSSSGILKKDNDGEGDASHPTPSAQAPVAHARFQEPPKPERLTSPIQRPAPSQSRALSDGELEGAPQARRRIAYAEPRRPSIFFGGGKDDKPRPRRGLSSSPLGTPGPKHERASTEAGPSLLYGLPQPPPPGPSTVDEPQPRKRSIAFHDETNLGTEVAQQRAELQSAREARAKRSSEAGEEMEKRPSASVQAATPLRHAAVEPTAIEPPGTAVATAGQAAGPTARKLTFAASPDEVARKHVQRFTAKVPAPPPPLPAKPPLPETVSSATSSPAPAPAMEPSASASSRASEAEPSQVPQHTFVTPMAGFEARPSTPPPSPTNVRMTGPGGGAPRPGHIVLLSAPSDRSLLRARRGNGRTAELKGAAVSTAVGHATNQNGTNAPKRMCGSPAPEKLTFREKVGGIRGGLGGSPAPKAGVWPELESDESDQGADDVDQNSDEDDNDSEDAGYDDDDESSDGEDQGQDSDWDEDSEEGSEVEHKAVHGARASSIGAPAWRHEAGLHIARTMPGSDAHVERLSSMLPETFYDDNIAEEEMLLLGPPRGTSAEPGMDGSAAGTSLPLLSQSSARSRSFGPTRSGGRPAGIGPARPGAGANGNSSSRSSSCNNALRGYLSSPARTPSASRSPSVSAGAGPGDYGLVSPRPTRPALGGHGAATRSTSTAGSSRSPLSSPALASPSLWAGASPATSYGTSRRSFSAAAGVRTPSGSGTPGPIKCAPSIDTQHTAASLLLSPRSNDDDGEHDAFRRLRDQLEAASTAASSPSLMILGGVSRGSTSRSASPAPHTLHANAPIPDPSAPSSPPVGLGSPLLSQAAQKLLSLQRTSGIEEVLDDGEDNAAAKSAMARGTTLTFAPRPAIVGASMRHSSSPDHMGLAARRSASSGAPANPHPNGAHAEQGSPTTRLASPQKGQKPIRISKAARDASLSADDMLLPGVAAARRKEVGRRRPYASEMGSTVTGLDEGRR